MPKANKSQVQPEPSKFKQVFDRLVQAREEAMKMNQFVNVELASTGTLTLEITINPSGAPALIVHTPRLTNRLVLRDVSMLDELKRLVELAKQDEEKLNAVAQFLAQYGYRTRSRGGYRITL
ncbi:MAG: hypothetical protein DRJ18_02270 [Candidatus Methanomethylicota archaeon]|nr:MAG: hypothetical protein DRJ18_02270 [Candidatus Verstraetearchaeota archaeon]